jgi:hypothetical protein
MEVTMYRAVTIALASAFLILAPTELLARGGGGGHGGGWGGGGSFGGGHAGFSGGHGRHMGSIQAGRGFHRNNFFIGGGDGGYYWGCYPIWNGYAWVNYCGYNY